MFYNLFTGCRARTIPFVSSFAAFLERKSFFKFINLFRRLGAADQIRMAAVSFGNVKFCGSHAGISIGDDGPSQMYVKICCLKLSTFLGDLRIWRFSVQFRMVWCYIQGKIDKYVFKKHT